MPSAIVKTIFFDLDKLAWTITAGGNALLQPLTIGQNDTIDFNVQFIKSGAAQTLTSPTFSAGIKVLNGFSDAFVVQFGAPTGTPPTYTFTATISSTELSAALLTGVQFAIEFRDSTNGIVTLPALTLNIVASYTISGTTPTSANGTLNVAAGKTVTFPQSLTFPSALGTNGFQLTTDGAGALTWATAGISGITIGTTTANGTAGRVLYTDGALVQQYAISGTGSVAMTNTPTLVTPVLGAATATSINGITISAGGSGTLTMAGNIDTSSGGGNIYTAGNGGSINTTSSGGSISTSSNGGNIFTNVGGGSIDTTGTGSIELGVTGTRTTFTGAASGSNKSIALPNLSGTVVVTAATSATATQALFAQATGFPAYRAIATADIATALTTPGAIGGTTASTGAFTTVSLKGATSGVVTLASPATATTATVTIAPAASVTMTLPSTSFTAARTDAAQTFTDTTDRNGTTAGSLILSGPGPALRLATTSSGGFFTVYTHPSNNNSYVGCPGSIIFTNSYNSAGATTFSVTSGGAAAVSSTLAVTGATTLTGLLTANGGITVVGGSVLLTTNSALSDGAQSSVGTLTNAPDTGNPTKWVAINDNGTERYIPTWTVPPPPP